MKCNGCGSNTAAWARMGFSEGKMYEVCDVCSNVAAPWNPDVAMSYPDQYKDGHVIRDPNLCDKKGQPIPFSSKREKAIIMKQLGVRQALSAEKVHGARNESHLHRKRYFFT